MQLFKLAAALFLLTGVMAGNSGGPGKGNGPYRMSSHFIAPNIKLEISVMLDIGLTVK
jgi:hypothetical protein